MMNTGEFKQLINELQESCTIAFMARMGDFEADESDAWSRIWFRKTEQIIENANKRIKALSERRILVFDDSISIRGFWIDIMKTVHSSVWTTNIVEQSKFGSELSDELLLLQKRAIEERGVNIKRIFIYDSLSDPALIELKNTMIRQIVFGIQVYAINRSRFESKSENIGKRLETDDFMILDNQHIYENIYDKKVHEHHNTLINNELIANEKNQIKSNLMKFAKRITLDNVGDFPNIY